jgi:uncharacterized membrane protein (DUF4010 family)
MEQFTAIPHNEISLKITLALAVGLLAGLERESASKDVGLRTFALTALLGLLCQFIGPAFEISGLVCILFLTVYMNVRAMWANRSLEVTTSVALIIIYVLGVLVGMGHVFTPVTAVILMTLLLAWKAELAAFAHGLKLEEIRSAVMLGLLTFVIYPILPNNYVDPWNLINPKDAWITVIVLAGISFVNYALLKIYSTKGLYYSALLGGAVNSSAAASEIAMAVKKPGGGFIAQAVPILLMTTVAMFIRNLAVLGIFAPSAIEIAATPLIGMTLTAVYFISKSRKKHDEGTSAITPSSVTSPVSLRRVLKFGVAFVVLQAAGTLAQRYLGSAGVLAVSFLGGFVSSASATAAAAKLASQGSVTPVVAGVATVLSSVSSAFINLPLVRQITKDKDLTRELGFTTLACIISGLALMAFVAWLRGYGF